MQFPSQKYWRTLHLTASASVFYCLEHSPMLLRPHNDLEPGHLLNVLHAVFANSVHARYHKASVHTNAVKVKRQVLRA